MKLNDDGRIDPVYFSTIDSMFLAQETAYKKYDAYMKGDNYTIINKVAGEPPDNRVPVPFARKIVKTLKGYMAKRGYITIAAKSGEDGEDYVDELKTEILDKNDEEIQTAGLLSDACGYGQAYELLQSNINNTDLAIDIKMYKIPGNKGLIIEDDSIEKNIIAFVYRTTVQEVINGTIENVNKQTIYYADAYINYRQGTDITTGTHWTQEGEEQAHPFGAVPVSVFQPNEEKIPIYKPVLHMIDEHDKIISSAYANELERYANSYLLLGKKISTVLDDNGLTETDKIAQMKIFDDLLRNGETGNVNNMVSFLVKPSRGQDAAESADRFERLIYDQSMCINPNDEDFGQLSGTALKIRLLPLEWLAADIEAYFVKGLQNRYMLIANALKETKGTQSEDISINFRRNIPIDMDALAKWLNDLKGIVSDETILNQIPDDIVPNKKAELEKLSEQLPAITVDDDSTDAN